MQIFKIVKAATETSSPRWVAVALSVSCMQRDMLAGLWDCGEGEVHTQGQISGAQNEVLDELVAEWAQEAGCEPYLPT